MTDLHDVLHRATDGLSPGAPDLLLERAVRRGSRLRRRRHTYAAASAVAGLAAAVVLVAALLGRPAPAVQQPPLVGSPSIPASIPASPSTPPSRPQVTVARTGVGATFARVLPGAITREHDMPGGRVHERGGYESTFDWNGYRVSVIISPFRGTPRERCVTTVGRSGGSQRCVRIPGGWAVHDDQMASQSYNRWASVYRDNGFHMWVLVYNSGAEKGSATAGPPPLDVPDLERVATSDLWFG